MTIRKTVCAILLTIPILGTAATPPVVAEVVNRIVLQVNDRIATLKDYELRRSQMLADLEQAAMSPDEKAAARAGVDERVFRDLYEEMILLSRADQLDIRVPDDRLDDVMVQIRQDMGVPDEESFEIALSQSGMSLEDFRERWRHNLRMREVVAREVTAEVQTGLTNEALRRIYREDPDQFRSPARARVREVVVLNDSPLSSEEREALAAELQTILAENEDVGTAIAEYAEGGSTSGLIEHGWIEPGELAGNLEDAAFDLAQGEVSEPIPARGGLHVLHVVERSEPTVRPFDEVVGQIRQREFARLQEARMREYMDEREETSYIRIAPPPEAEGFRQARGSLAEEVVPGEEATVEGELEQVAEDALEASEEATEGEPDVLPVGVATGSAAEDAPDASRPSDVPLEPTPSPDDPPEPADPPPAPH